MSVRGIQMRAGRILANGRGLSLCAVFLFQISVRFTLAQTADPQEDFQAALRQAAETGQPVFAMGFRET